MITKSSKECSVVKKRPLRFNSGLSDYERAFDNAQKDFSDDPFVREAMLRELAEMIRSHPVYGPLLALEALDMETGGIVLPDRMQRVANKALNKIRDVDAAFGGK